MTTNIDNIEKYIRFLLDGVIEDYYEITKKDDGKYLIQSQRISNNL
jgi:hypothetical protein